MTYLFICYQSISSLINFENTFSTNFLFLTCCRCVNLDYCLSIETQQMLPWFKSTLIESGRDVGSSSVKMNKIHQEQQEIVCLTSKIRARANDQFVLCESLQLSVCLTSFIALVKLITLIKRSFANRLKKIFSKKKSLVISRDCFLWSITGNNCDYNRYMTRSLVGGRQLGN